MQYSLPANQLPHGFALESAEKGESTNVAVAGFFTDRDGDIFYNILEGITKLYLGTYTEKGSVSSIDRLLIIMKEDKVDVHINYFNYLLDALSAKDIKEGDHIHWEHITGVSRLSFQDIELSEDSGLIFYFSLGWRRGLYFDLRPNSGERLENIYNILGSHFGSLYYLKQYDVVANTTLSESLFNLGWFSFVSLVGPKKIKLDRLIERIQENKSTEATEIELVNSFQEDDFSKILERLKRIPQFKRHIPFIDCGINHYIKTEYLSCISVVWLRIEGILRDAFSTTSKERINLLLENMLEKMKTNAEAYPDLFFPDSFKDYLTSYYFRDFDLFAGDTTLSRHSMGHGVSDANDYDQKRALIGILIIDQLGHYIRIIKPREDT